MKNILILFLGLAMTYAGTTKKIFDVKGMMCSSGCATTINKTIQSLNGVENVKVDFSTKKMEVICDNSLIKTENIIGSLPNPYKVTLIKETVSKEYAVGGMTCMGCVNSIKSTIDGLEGLENYDISIEKETLFLEFDISKTDDKIILSKIPEKFKVVEIIKTNEEEEV